MFRRIAGLAGVTSAATAAVLAAAAPAAATIVPGYHMIQDRDWALCLDVLGAKDYNGAPVGVWHCVGAVNQQWSMEPTGTGWSRLRVQHTGKCLTAQSTGNGATIVQDVCEDRLTQQWLAFDGRDGWSKLSLRAAPDKCLDKNGWGSTIWTCQTVKWQEWNSLG